MLFVSCFDVFLSSCKRSLVRETRYHSNSKLWIETHYVVKTREENGKRYEIRIYHGERRYNEDGSLADEERVCQEIHQIDDE